MIVYQNLGFSKNHYKKFNIKNKSGKINDDYFMMNQVLKRRFDFSSEWKKDLPSLIIVDGGKGQLNIALKVLKERKINNVDVVSIAKGKNRNKDTEKVFNQDGEINFRENEKELFLLQRLRDEAHRFAVSSQKIRRNISYKNSLFNDISGIGKKLKTNLLSYFGSIDNIKSASLSDLKKVPGIGGEMAKKFTGSLIKLFKLNNVPNFLTILRILLIPGIIICIELDQPKYSWLALSFYIFACFSDFLDGYIARKYDIESNFGKFLDPIADKILIVALLIILLDSDKISGVFVYPTLVIILREVIVSGLRDFFLHSSKNLAVTNLSKWKTVIQMTSLGFLIVEDNFSSNFILYVGNIGLTIASIVTIYTGYIYFKRNLKVI